MPMRMYCPARGRASRDRADDDGHRVGGLGPHLDDAAAQVGAGAQRVDEVEVVLGHERGGEGLGHPAGATQDAPEGSGGGGAEPGARHPQGRGRSVDGGSALTYASVTYANVTYENAQPRRPARRPH